MQLPYLANWQDQDCEVRDDIYDGSNYQHSCDINTMPLFQAAWNNLGYQYCDVEDYIGPDEYMNCPVSFPRPSRNEELHV